MPKIYTKLLLTAFSLLFLVSCQNDDAPAPEPKSNVLFSVNTDKERHGGSIKGYIAAYTPEGELLNYGSLADSAKWDLKAKYDGAKIDIVYFDVVNGQGLTANHFKNVTVGQTFTDSGLSRKSYPTTGTKDYNLKIEDFGNQVGNNTATSTFATFPLMRTPGNAYSGEFSWKKIESGYGYATKGIFLDNDPNPLEEGIEVILFERGTNTPYIKYIDLTNKNNNDLITLNKSDFTAAQTKFVQVNAKSTDFDGMFLYTYNSKTGRRYLTTSYDYVSLTGNKIAYISSTYVLPTSYWTFAYVAKAKNTGYGIKSNAKEIPATITIKDLTGQSITKNGSKYALAHAAIFPDKKLARTYVTFNKRLYEARSFQYTIQFDPSESVGTTQITPFKLPIEILKKYTDFTTIDNEEWKTGSYGQIYTNFPNNSPLDYLKNNLLQWINNDKSDSEYTYETFSIQL